MAYSYLVLCFDGEEDFYYDKNITSECSEKLACGIYMTARMGIYSQHCTTDIDKNLYRFINMDGILTEGKELLAEIFKGKFLSDMQFRQDLKMIFESRHRLSTFLFIMASPSICKWQPETLAYAKIFTDKVAKFMDMCINKQWEEYIAGFLALNIYTLETRQYIPKQKQLDDMRQQNEELRAKLDNIAALV